MIKKILGSIFLVGLMASCATEYTSIYKTGNQNYKYEYAKECFLRGKYVDAISLLQDLVIYEKGTENAQESLLMLAMAQYHSKDYSSAAQTFKKYVQVYPQGVYADLASFYVGQSLYMSTPEPRLDQSQTVAAIQAFQEYLDAYPDAKRKEETQQRLFDLQDKLVLKELKTAQLYYDLGPYFGNSTMGGNNYEACIVTAQNALKDFPYSKQREEFAVLIMKSKFELAQQSVESKRYERFQDAQDECYGFINEYPDSKERATAERYIAKCKEVIAKAPKEED